MLDYINLIFELLEPTRYYKYGKYPLDNKANSNFCHKNKKIIKRVALLSLLNTYICYNTDTKILTVIFIVLQATEKYSMILSGLK